MAWTNQPGNERFRVVNELAIINYIHAQVGRRHDNNPARTIEFRTLDQAVSALKQWWYRQSILENGANAPTPCVTLNRFMCSLKRTTNNAARNAAENRISGTMA